MHRWCAYLRFEFQGQCTSFFSILSHLINRGSIPSKLGTTIAHYKITAKLGQGGMGEMYRATDTKLDREVAIKVLPQSVSQDKERLARFEREAKVLAQLNHPNIAGVYGLEQSGDTQALILELVEGNDLSVCLKRGPLPVEEVLDVCKQIAEALESAHEKGIIHRDLKPANIKMTSDGRIKVLDFGLAKAVIAESNPSDADSPTITAEYTLPGTLLGTAGYMSPEQAKGKAVDKRSDIWSFGVLVWECLTGESLFKGESVTDSLGALLHREIDWSKLPTTTPPTIQLLLRKCLTRDRKRRLQYIADARVDLEQAVIDPNSSFIGLSEASLLEATHRKKRQPIAWIGLVLVTICLTIGVTILLKPEPQLPLVRRLTIELGDSVNLLVNRGVNLRYSPDGNSMAYMANNADGAFKQLYLRNQGELEARPMEGTEGVNDFCFSPNGKHIAFNYGGGLKVLQVSGGGPTKTKRIGGIRGLHWGEDGYIYFGGRQLGVRRVASAAANSADAETLTTLNQNENSLPAT